MKSNDTWNIEKQSFLRIQFQNRKKNINQKRKRKWTTKDEFHFQNEISKQLNIDLSAVEPCPTVKFGWNKYVMQISFSYENGICITYFGLHSFILALPRNHVNCPEHFRFGRGLLPSSFAWNIRNHWNDFGKCIIKYQIVILKI